MGKITEVYYEQIDSKEYDINKAAEYYYYLNMLGVNNELNSRYEEIEYNQLKLKQRLLSKVKQAINRDIKASNSMLGISNLNNKAIIISELEEGCV